MSDLMTLEDTHNATGLQESVVGQKRSGLPDGLQIDLFGLDHVPAKVSAQRENKKDLMTKDTYGPSGSSLSKSVNLQSFLASRLSQQLDTDGSILFLMTWKDKVTKSGRRYCQLAASAHRTSESACSSWPTVSTRDHKGGYIGGRIRNGKLSTDTLDVTAQLTAWTTPSASDATRGGIGITKNMSGSSLAQMSKMVTGQTVTGSYVEMKNTGQLNPEHCRWLMGYPKEWSKYADMGTQ